MGRTVNPLHCTLTLTRLIMKRYIESRVTTQQNLNAFVLKPHHWSLPLSSSPTLSLLPPAQRDLNTLLSWRPALSNKTISRAQYVPCITHFLWGYFHELSVPLHVDIVLHIGCLNQGQNGGLIKANLFVYPSLYIFIEIKVHIL